MILTVDINIYLFTFFPQQKQPKFSKRPINNIPLLKITQYPIIIEFYLSSYQLINWRITYNSKIYQ